MRAVMIAILGTLLIGCGQPMDSGDPADPGAGAQDQHSQEPYGVGILVEDWNLGWLWSKAIDGGTLRPTSHNASETPASDQGTVTAMLPPDDNHRFVRYALPDVSRYDSISLNVSTTNPQPGAIPTDDIAIACLVGDGARGSVGSCAYQWIKANQEIVDYKVYLTINKATNQGWWNIAQNLIVTTRSNWDHTQHTELPADADEVDTNVDFTFSASTPTSAQ
jgi:hypothetical protein